MRSIGDTEFATKQIARSADRTFRYVRALDLFGHSGSKRTERYLYWGLKRRSNEQSREDYIREVNPILLSLGLKIPDPLDGRRYI